MYRSLLFVCALNTCRSIAAQAIFDYIVSRSDRALAIQSAGLWASHGQACDSTLKKLAAMRGYDLSAYRSTALYQLAPCDYDRVFIFEHAHREPVQQWMGEREAAEYLMHYSSYFDEDEVLVFDSGDRLSGYNALLDRIEDACLGLYKQLSIPADCRR